MKKKSIISLLLAGVMLATTACGGASSVSNSENNQVVIAFMSDVDSLDPAHMYETYTTMIFSGTYETLYKFEDEASSAVPKLVDTYEVSSDGTQVTMKLKEGITFASGNKMTADDVAFTLMRVKNLMGNPSSMAEYITDVEVVDELTFTIHMTQADSSLQAKLAFGCFSILDSEVVIANGGISTEDAAMNDKASAYLDTTSAGSGPYIMESHTPNVETILVRNDEYWGELPEVEKIILKDIPDPNTQLMMVSSGDVDIAFNLNTDTAGQLAGNDNVVVQTGLTKSFAFLYMNMDEEIGGPVSNPLVQEAISYAVDYEGLKYIAGEGTVTPASVIQVGFLGSVGELDADYRDLDKAKALLAEAGYADGFTIDFPVTDLLPEGVALTDIAQKLKADLEEVGIILNIQTSTWAGGYGDQYRNGEIGFSVMYWAADYNDPNVELKFLPGKLMGLRANWVEGSAPELEALYDQAMAAQSDDELVGILADVQEYMSESSPFIPIAQFPTQLAVNKDLDGVQFSNLYRTDLVNLAWK